MAIVLTWGQSTHTSVSAASASEYAPGWQRVQLCDPTSRQSASAVLPASEVASSGQAVHPTEPFVGLYVAAAQAVHGPPLLPLNPGSQMQPLFVLPASEKLFPGQLWHSDSPVKPSSSLYVPAAQLEQAPLPSTFLKVPAGHAAHGAPSGPVKPRLQVQLSTDQLMIGEIWLDGQSCRTPSMQKTSTGHGRHAVPGGPWYPLVHEHAVMRLEPGAETVCCGHAFSFPSLHHESEGHLVHAPPAGP
eukprot:3047829-Rhodomonas_salina.1